MFEIQAVLSREEFSERSRMWRSQKECKCFSSMNLTKDVISNCLKEILYNISYAGISGPAKDDRWCAITTLESHIY